MAPYKYVYHYTKWDNAREFIRGGSRQLRISLCDDLSIPCRSMRWTDGEANIPWLLSSKSDSEDIREHWKWRNLEIEKRHGALKSHQARFVVITTVKVKPESIDLGAQLFAEINPTLAEKEVDWVDTKLTVDRTKNEVTVLAFWKNDTSYLQFSSSQTFQETMKCFTPYLSEPQSV